MRRHPFQSLVLGLALGIVGIVGSTVLARASAVAQQVQQVPDAQQAPGEIVCIRARAFMAGAVEVDGKATPFFMLLQVVDSGDVVPTYPQVQMCARRVTP